ncbi:MAG: TonB-dependent receptor [Myxococcales bacterium FL481]|nr:MAG: TonB-dependent receptor [Myxococcales bacterium FL481]
MQGSVPPTTAAPGSATPPNASQPAPVPTPQPAAEVSPAQEEAVPEWETDSGDDEDPFGDFEIEDLSDDEELLDAVLKEDEVQATGKVSTLSGTVTNTRGELVIGANVEVTVGGQTYVGKTGADGAYSLAVPPGLHTVTVRQDGHQAKAYSEVNAPVNETVTLDAELVPTGQDMVVEVSAERNKEVAGADLEERQSSVATRDIIGRAEMSRSGGGSAARVASRVVGATVVDGRYVFVRGLGHRYGNLLLDGARVPSPEPELRTVPLDMFPSGALSAMDVQKTARPGTPPDFAGGSTQLATRDIPSDLVASFGISTEFNTETSLQPMVTNRGYASSDLFGFGNAPRATPDWFPDDSPVGRNVPDPDNPRLDLWSPEEVEEQGEAMLTETEILEHRRAPMNVSGKFSLGNGWTVGERGRLGVLVAGGYKNKHQTTEETVRQFGGSQDGTLDEDSPQVDYAGERTVYNVAWNSIGLLRWEINPDHKLRLLALYSRDADDETRDQIGIAPGVAGPDTLKTTRLRYVMRSVALAQLGAEHRLPRASNLTIDYFGAVAQARRDDPAIRSMQFRQSPQTGEFRLDDSSGPSSMSQVYLDLVDNSANGALNIALPFHGVRGLDSKIQIGGWLETRRREFYARRYTFQIVSGTNASIPSGVGNILNDDTIGGGGIGDLQPLVLNEVTRPSDSYRASQDVYAGHAGLELPLARWFAISGGARIESSDMEVEPFDTYGRPTTLESARLLDLDILPSASILISPARPVEGRTLNVRLSGAKTLARPEFRELAPFSFTDFVGGRNIAGNPNVISSDIWNADARIEWFPGSGEVLAASVFYKQFIDPIERVAPPAMISFANADSAVNVGGELELRKDLGFMAPKESSARKVFKRLTVGANFAYTYSQVRLRPPCDLAVGGGAKTDDCADVVDKSTSRERPLQGQSPYVANAFVDYDDSDSGFGLRVLYNTFGRRIDTVGALGLPDIYEEPRHTLDVVLSQRLLQVYTAEFVPPRHVVSVQLGASNLLNAQVLHTQGDTKATTYAYYPGLGFSLGIDWRY